jgi:DNA ligase-1
VSILHSEKLNPESYQQLHHLREQATLHHTEGLMLKRLNSTYGVGRKRGDWWKWKIEPETADAVLIYAQKGHGKRASRYTDFTFALKKGDELVPFAKAYSGLSNKELEEINAWIKDNTRERFGPVCSVNAELVFEIAFEGVNKSSRHKSGIAVRFPRIVRWRRDKKVSDINSVDDLLPN